MSALIVYRRHEQRDLLLNDPVFQISLPLEDLKLIATNVSADQWEVVAERLGYRCSLAEMIWMLVVRSRT